MLPFRQQVATDAWGIRRHARRADGEVARLPGAKLRAQV